MEMIWVWLAVVAVSLIIEFITWDLTSIWFAVAGLISLILSAIDGINWIWQLGVFIVLSALLIIFVRQICKKLLLKTDEKTNVDAFIGKRTKLLTSIGENENFGTLKFNGVVWNATAEDNSQIAEQSEVEIVKVDGNKMIVKKVSEKLEKETSSEKELEKEPKEEKVQEEVSKEKIEVKAEEKDEKTTKKAKNTSSTKEKVENKEKKTTKKTAKGDK